MSVQPDSAPVPSAAADLGDAAVRARAEPANLPAGNVIPFVRPKRERDAPAVVLHDGDRPAPPLASAGDFPVVAFLAGSLLLHAAVYALFDRPAEPLASIGLEAMTVEIVLGADTPAGLARQPSESEAQPSAPAPEQAAEAERTEVAQAEPPRPTEPVSEAAPASEPAAQPPEPILEAKTEPAAPPDPLPPDIVPEPAPPEPAPTPELARETPPPAKVEPAPEPATPVREAARHPAAKPKPAERQTGRRRPAAAASVASAASSGIGRGRSDAETNYPGLVAAHLARHKRFPAEARGRGEQGVATVRFTLDGSGRVGAVALVRPTGIASLDRESQDVVRRASPFPPPPSGKPMSFTVPVRFSLM